MVIHGGDELVAFFPDGFDFGHEGHDLFFGLYPQFFLLLDFGFELFAPFCPLFKGVPQFLEFSILIVDLVVHVDTSLLHFISKNGHFQQLLSQLQHFCLQLFVLPLLLPQAGPNLILNFLQLAFYLTQLPLRRNLINLLSRIAFTWLIVQQ